MALMSVVSLVFSAQVTQDPCTVNPSGPKCIGRWMDPIELCAAGPTSIGCNPRGDCDEDPCTISACQDDEVAHASLIPTGPHAGEVILWTRCDQNNPWFKSYFWSPALGVTGSVVFPPTAPQAFCDGHTWALDATGKAKLLCVGGSVTNHVYWFDPETSAWNLGSDPVDLPVRAYYPSVLTYGNDANKQSMVAVVGGTASDAAVTCSLYQRWWKLASPFTSGSWTEQLTSSYGWFQYPRALLLSQNYVFSPGHIVTCELGDGDLEDDQDMGTDWGGNPAQVVNLDAGAHQNLANLDPNVQFGNFGGTHLRIGGWNYSNAAVFHTLKSGWTWPSDPSQALSRYDLDRVLVFAGAPKLLPGPGNPFWDAHSVVLELQGAGTLPPSQWSWIEKARAAEGRVTSNWVVLPSRHLLAVGGGRRTGGSPTTILVSSAERFDPQGTQEPGEWKAMHSRIVPAGQSIATPRGYHSAALLLPSGEVALMGGQHIPGLADPVHTLEIYRPPYCYSTSRPSLTNVPAEILYPNGVEANTFCVTSNVGQLFRACLIGLPSVTHHFDYGQRYVELMARKTNCSVGNVEVFPPPKASMAPPGYYMLFLIDWQGLPSTGVFVKLDYQRP